MANDITTVSDGVSITKSGICQITGKRYEVSMSVVQYKRWKNGEHLRWVVPNLNADHREFLETGVTQAEWDALFPMPE